MEPNYPKRVHLAHLPTPVESLTRLSKHLGGPELYIKRDDQTGLATGGNKTRKLEFLIAEALAQGADHVITSGAPQSNHCRQTAAAAARSGLGCTLILRGQEPDQVTGNFLLDELLGAHVNWTGDREAKEVIQEVEDQLEAMGRKPYIVPYGGSNVVGATGYVLAMQELMAQLAEKELNIDFIVFASSSGGTQAGLVLGAQVYDYRGSILGISVDHPADTIKTQVGALATATATHLESRSLLGRLPTSASARRPSPGHGRPRGPRPLARSLRDSTGHRALLRAQGAQRRALVQVRVLLCSIPLDNPLVPQL